MKIPNKNTENVAPAKGSASYLLRLRHRRWRCLRHECDEWHVIAPRSRSRPFRKHRSARDQNCESARDQNCDGIYRSTNAAATIFNPTGLPTTSHRRCMLHLRVTLMGDQT